MLEGVLQGREDSAELRRLRGEGELVETLTREIANEYRKRAMLLPANGLQDIGKRRELRKELQARCDLTELQAVKHHQWFSHSGLCEDSGNQSRKGGAGK